MDWRHRLKKVPHLPLLGLIVVLAIIHVLQWVLPVTFTDYWKAVPAEIMAVLNPTAYQQDFPAALQELSTLITYAFLHGGLEHILFNCLYLWIFASLVAEALGYRWMFVIFIVTAIGGGIGHMIVENLGDIGVIGASGSVMGFEGVYLALYIRFPLRDPDVWPISSPIPPRNLLILTLMGVSLDISGIIHGGGGVSYGAHLGGLITGFFIGSVLVRSVRHTAVNPWGGR